MKKYVLLCSALVAAGCGGGGSGGGSNTYDVTLYDDSSVTVTWTVQDQGSRQVVLSPGQSGTWTIPSGGCFPWTATGFSNVLSGTICSSGSLTFVPASAIERGSGPSTSGEAKASSATPRL
jgi:hypothetical protein